MTHVLIPFVRLHLMIMIPLLYGCREREDLMGGGTSSASVDDSQEGEGGFQEGYWR